MIWLSETAQELSFESDLQIVSPGSSNLVKLLLKNDLLILFRNPHSHIREKLHSKYFYILSLSQY